jgi:hypothetical protein
MIDFSHLFACFEIVVGNLNTGFGTKIVTVMAMGLFCAGNSRMMDITLLQLLCLSQLSLVCDFFQTAQSDLWSLFH